MPAEVLVDGVQLRAVMGKSQGNCNGDSSFMAEAFPAVQAQLNREWKNSRMASIIRPNQPLSGTSFSATSDVLLTS